MSADAQIQPVVSASRGEIREVAARPLLNTEIWRCNFDLISDGTEPIDLRRFLKDDRDALTETWLYQWTPPM